MNQNMNSYNQNTNYMNRMNSNGMNHMGNMNNMHSTNRNINNPNVSSNPVPCRKDLMNSIYEIGFALDDIILFLDTHPSNQEALNYYQKLRKQYHDLVKTYSIHYGPLLARSVICDNPFSWSKKKMPWEREV